LSAFSLAVYRERQAYPIPFSMCKPKKFAVAAGLAGDFRRARRFDRITD